MIADRTMLITRGVFLILAGCASLIELGPMVSLLANGGDLIGLLLAGLAYQAGNALPHKIPFAPRLMPVFATCVGTALVASLAPGSLPWAGGICLLSWSLQSIRRAVASVAGHQLASTAEKRTARVVGFVLAGFLPVGAWLGVSCIAITAGFFCSSPGLIPRNKPAEAGSWGMIEWIMLVHQMHYFSYCYALPMLFANSGIGGVSLIGFWFALGWISYLAAEAFWNRFPPLPVFLGGHASLVVVLASMAWFGSDPRIVVGLWILSGLGGGTVYCLKLLRRRLDRGPDSLERAEDAGHILGVGCALLAAAGPGWSADKLPAMGAVWALFAVVMMIVAVRRAPLFGECAEERRGSADAGH